MEKKLNNTTGHRRRRRRPHRGHLPRPRPPEHPGHRKALVGGLATYTNEIATTLASLRAAPAWA